MAALQRIDFVQPLSLVRDLLRLTGGQADRDALAALADHPGRQRLCRLHWPVGSRVGLCLATARAMRESLSGRTPEPAILLLTHPYFAAEGLSTTGPPHLRALFVQYPNQHVQPPFAGHCERWETVAPDDTDRLGQILGRLVG